MLPGLARTAITLNRPTTAADAEGDYTNATGSATTILGAWGSPSETEVTGAAQRDQTVDIVCVMPLGTDVRPMDRVQIASLPAQTYVVTGVKRLIPHLRVMVREVSG